MATEKNASFAELRTKAKRLGINVAGKKPEDLRRLVQKAEAGAKGKGTAADPKPKTARGVPAKVAAAPVKAVKKPAKAVEVEDEGDIDDEEDEETVAVAKKPAKKAAKTPEPSLAQVFALVTALGERVALIEAALVEAGESDEEADEEVEEEEDEEADEEEEEEDEEEEEEEEEEPAPKKKASKAAPKKKTAKVVEEDDEEVEEEEDAEEEDEEEDAEEEDEDEDDTEEVEITSEQLDNANLDELKEIAAAINESGEGTVNMKGAEKSPRVLRERIREVLNKAAAKEKAPAAKAKGGAVPEYIAEGAKVEVEVEDEEDADNVQWVKGVVTSINAKKKTCEVAIDGLDEDTTVPWDSMRAGNTRGKSRK